MEKIIDNRPWLPAKVQMPLLGNIVQVRFDDKTEGVGILVEGTSGKRWITKTADDKLFTDHSLDNMYVSDWRLLVNHKKNELI